MKEGRPIPPNMPLRDPNAHHMYDVWGPHAPPPRPAHFTPIAHLDLKCENIVLGEPMEIFPAFLTPKVIDFGCARRVGLNPLGRVGTPGLQPPEVHTTRNAFSSDRPHHESDIWAAGMIAFCLMEGQSCTPFPDTPWRPFQHFAGYSGMYSKQLEDIVFRCVAVDVRDRPTILDLLYESRTGLERFATVHALDGRAKEDVPYNMRMPWGWDQMAKGIPVPEGMVRKKRRAVEDE
ncbi:kinase-like protein, partial [Polyplosphaeria fusca]